MHKGEIRPYIRYSLCWPYPGIHKARKHEHEQGQIRGNMAITPDGEKETTCWDAAFHQGQDMAW